MIYYLEDHVTYGVLLITEDLFLLNNIRAGILDCYIRMFSTPTQTVDTLKTHLNKTTNDTGMKIVPGGVFEFPLDDHPDFKKKQELVKLRKVAFETLIDSATRFRTNNNYGFFNHDVDAINHALTDQSAINEYAMVMGSTFEFAREELTMLRDSFYQDNFRIFTVCKMWKEKINKCESVDEINALIPSIKQSFWLSGIPNV
jgi:hypothetical protein